MARKDFKKHNEGFICQKCGEQNPPAVKSERNHCRKCLFSLHVDLETPGDRASQCEALMEPISLDHRGNKGFMILHRCQKCRKEMWNRAAEDDELAGECYS
ncbi:MAG: RNHCP domain-containing protein [Patescibacteria group bacterium]